MKNWQDIQIWLNKPNPLENAYKDGSLQSYLPEVYALFGIPQPKEHHPEIDSGVHTCLVLEYAKKISDKTEIWFAALTHDLGKALTPVNNWPQHINHEELGLAPLNEIITRFNIPEDVARLARIACKEHLKAHKAFDLRPGSIIQWFEKLGFYADTQGLYDFLQVCESDACGRLGLEHQLYLQQYLLKEIYNLSIEMMKLPMLNTREITLNNVISKVKHQIPHFSDVNAKKNYIIQAYNLSLNTTDLTNTNIM